MLDTTSYTDKLTPELNLTLKSFTGYETIMVRKVKEKDSLKGKAGNCHINVKKYIEKNGGTSVSGWLLNRIPTMNEKGMYVWSFHSVWMKPDGKLVDVTDDRHYIGRDKSIFIPDAKRVPDLVEGLSYNNIVIFTDRAFAQYYGNSIGFEILPNKVYWCDTVITRLIGQDEHSGVYRLLSSEYKHNLDKLCEEYELEIVNGKPVPKAGSKYVDGFPIKAVFDYSLSSRG